MAIKTYCGYINNDKKVIKSASGGLATSMAEKIISEGNVVYGVSYAPDFKSAEYIRVNTFDGITRLKGSKYIKAIVKKDILEVIIKDLKSGKKVLFVGLPCDVNVVREYIKKENIDDTNILLVDLICHGATSPRVAKDYIETLEKKFKSKIIDFSVRYKNPYWTPPYLFAQFENKKTYLAPFYRTDYGIAFTMMSGMGCYTCKFKNDNYKSDITIGDYWGSKEGDVGYNKYGSSVAFVHTEKGNAFINSLENFSLYVADTKRATEANPRYITPTEMTAKKAAFRENFNKNGLKYAISKHLTIKQKISRKIPRFIVSFLKGKRGK